MWMTETTNNINVLMQTKTCRFSKLCARKKSICNAFRSMLSINSTNHILFIRRLSARPRTKSRNRQSNSCLSVQSLPHGNTYVPIDQSQPWRARGHRRLKYQSINLKHISLKAMEYQVASNPRRKNIPSGGWGCGGWVGDRKSVV